MVLPQAGSDQLDLAQTRQEIGVHPLRCVGATLPGDLLCQQAGLSGSLAAEDMGASHCL